MHANIWKGAIAASVVAVAGVLLAFWGYAVAFGQDPRATAGAVFGHLSFFAVLFGWPLAFAVSLTVGASLRGLRREQSWRGAWRVHCVAFAVAGAIILPLLWMGLWASANGALSWVPIGALVGSAAGGAFWYFGRTAADG